MNLSKLPAYNNPAAIPKSGLVALADQIRTYFENNGIAAKVLLGLKARNLWDEPRVVIVDGLFDGSLQPKTLDAGQLTDPVKAASYNPREIAAWERPITFCVRGVDPTELENEAAQIEAQENLIESTLQAIRSGINPQATNLPTRPGGANVKFAKAVWVHPPVEFAYGKELLVQATLAANFYDLPQQISFPSINPFSKNVNTSKYSGQNAVVQSTGNGFAVITGLAFVDTSWVGGNLSLSGANSQNNNGSFVVDEFVSPFATIIVNPLAVAPDSNNGSISWGFSPSP